MTLRNLLHALLFGILVAIIGTAIVFGVRCIYGEPPPTYIATIDDAEQVYDGDTIKDVRVIIYQFDDVRGEVWPGIHIYENRIEVETDIRIAGIDTPEKRPSTKNPDGTRRSEWSRQAEKKASLAARDVLMELLQKNSLVMTLISPQHGKYAGRTVAQVYTHDIDVAEHLIKQGHAKPYDGGTKPDWGWGQ